MNYTKKQLPSFMRMSELKRYEIDNKLHYIKENDIVKGFYVLDESQFKCLYIEPSFRNNGLATRVITEVMKNMQITIAVTKRDCSIKRIITKLNFYFTGKTVQGKQSKLEIYQSTYYKNN